MGLAELERGTRCEEALAYFDGLPAVKVEQMLGRWRGSGLPTGHPMDGLLEALRWYGKEFKDADHVHPLLFQGRSDKLLVLAPSRIPLGLAVHAPHSLARLFFPLVRPLLTTRRYGARLRMTEFRGVSSATMIYDQQPINDIFRKVDDDTVLGLMDMRGMEQPFFFVLRRAP